MKLPIDLMFLSADVLVSIIIGLKRQLDLKVELVLSVFGNRRDEGVDQMLEILDAIRALRAEQLRMLRESKQVFRGGENGDEASICVEELIVLARFKGRSEEISTLCHAFAQLVDESDCLDEEKQRLNLK